MMKYYLICISILLLFKESYSQTNKKTQQRTFSVSLFGQVNSMLYDRTKGQNGQGFGGGIQVAYKLNRSSAVFIEGLASIYGGTKEIRVINGQALIPKDEVNSIHAGYKYRVSGPLFMSTSTGTYYFLNKTAFGFRQVAYLYFSEKQRAAFRLSFDHVFQENNLYTSNFGMLGYAFLIKLF